MKISLPTKRITIEVISYLYILLFVYAAVSKVSEFDNFRAELGQSPLLSAYTGWMSIAVPLAELLIALLLVFNKFRLIGMYLAFSMMVMFTAYIIIILNFSTYIPCSCGGILGEMGWTEHLIFNILFIILGVTAIFLILPPALNEQLPDRRKVFRCSYGMLMITVLSTGLVATLYATSESLMHQSNPFIRRFQGFAIKSAEIELPNNNYYFAGKDNGKIFMGNSSAPLYITEVDTLLKMRRRHKIKLDNYDYPFLNVRVQVIPPNFYLYDGTVPIVFKGNVSDWQGHAVASKAPYFSSAIVLDSVTIAFRSENANDEYVLGHLSLLDKEEPVFREGLLRKQIDGFFDCDGMLQYDREQKKVLYLYYYRNQFLVMDESLSLLHEGRTIDTITRARLKVANLKDRGERKLAAPPYIVNIQSTASNDRLFVNSAVQGRYEDREMWKVASIVDVYNTRDMTYQSSIYIYDAGKLKMSSMIAYGSTLYVLLGYHLHSYKLYKI